MRNNLEFQTAMNQSNEVGRESSNKLALVLSLGLGLGVNNLEF